MNTGKNDKKINPMTKTMKQKKLNLQINTHIDTDPGVKSMPTGFTTFAQDNTTNNTKSISTVNSPTAKNNTNLNQITEFDPYPPSKKKIQTAGNHVQKKGSGKQAQPPKIELQHKMSANLMTSPKGQTKDKVLPSFGSEKNLGSMKPVEKRQTPSKVSKIQELQRNLQQQKLRNSKLVIKENENSTVINQLKNQNEKLKEQNNQLKKKIQKYKNNNDQTKKMLKQRINTFNEQGGELQTLKNQIKTLQSRVQSLLKENIDLKSELNKFSDYNLKRIKDYTVETPAAQNMATSTVRQVTPLQGSRICSLYLKDSQQAALKQFNGMDDVESNLDLQSYITQQQQSYLDEYKTNVCIFDSIKQQYQQIINSIQQRYKKLVQELKQTISQQEAQFYQIELKNDQLNVKCQTKNMSNSDALALDWDQALMRKQQQMNNMTLVLYDLKDQNKELIQDVQQLRVHSKFLQSQLQVQRLKKKFKDQNDKFQFNIVKLNLLNIIDKLKMQIDREKSKNLKLRENKEIKVEI